MSKSGTMLVVLAATVSPLWVSKASAQEPVVCPARFIPVAAAATEAPGLADRDRNANGVICLNFPSMGRTGVLVSDDHAG
jgi:hypothetical protein